jgi:hypothetical protein
MSLILSGTDGLSDIDGSAATPAIRGTDTNTGIFFPAADTIAFAEGGVEVARFDSSGRLGLGTTNPTQKLVVSDGSVVAGNSGSVLIGRNSSSFPSPGAGYFSLETNNTDGSNGGLSIRTLASDTLTERMRIESGGNVLIGTTSSTGAKFDVTQSINIAAASAFFDSRQATTSNQFGIVQRLLNDPNNTSQYLFNGIGNATDRCVIRSNGGIANYQANNVNLSDQREKTNFAPAKSYLDVICSIPVQTFNYIDQNREEDDGLTLGVIAQDVEAVAPELVMESNWGTQEEPKMRLSIYQTDLQYALMKCIQEQQAIITDLKSRIEALEQV